MSKHIHTYARLQVGNKKDKLMDGERVYKCLDPDCTHYARESMVKGKRSLCTACRGPFVIDTYTLRKHSQLKCMLCRNTKESKAIKETQSILDEIVKPFVQPKEERENERETFFGESD